MSQRTGTESADEVFGQIEPDRLAALEEEIQRLRSDLDKERYNAITTEGVIRDLGRKMIEMTQIHMDTVRELGKLTDHVVRHDEDYRQNDMGAVFCSFCYPKEGTR